MSQGMDPLARYEALLRTHPQLSTSESTSSWRWDDSYIINDFNRLKKPDISLANRLNYLKMFYLIYFGEITSSSNLGGLLLQLFVSSPHPSDSSGRDLIPFSEGGNIELTTYEAPPNLTETFKRFLDAGDNQNIESDYEDDIEAAPIEPVEGKLVTDDNESPSEDKIPGGTSIQMKIIDKEDIISFKAAVKAAFTALLGEKEPSFSHVSYRSLHLTALFLILLLMRRIVKRPEDILTAFSRANIHTDMIENPFGMTLPPPSSLLNKVLDQVLSTQNKPSRELYTVALWLLQHSTVGLTDRPVGLLEQKDVGVEALLRATCMTHIAGAGLPLITLFVTMKTLYNKTERQALEWLAYPELIQGIERIVKLREDQCDLLKRNKDVKLFPYCRLIHQKFHPELGYRGNESICYLMACLIDQRSPPQSGTGGAANAFWTQTMNSRLKTQISEAAKNLYVGTADFKLTAIYPGQLNYNTITPSGQKWIPKDDDEDEEDDLPVVNFARK